MRPSETASANASMFEPRPEIRIPMRNMSLESGVWSLESEAKGVFCLAFDSQLQTPDSRLAFIQL
jgi:hypothetical protein